MDDIAASDDATEDLDDLTGLDEPLASEPDRSSERTLVVVLAAGAGSRYSGDTHKLEAVLAGRTVAEHSIVAAIASGVGDVIVITGATQPTSATMRALAGAPASRSESPDPGGQDGGQESDGPVETAETAETAETVQFIHNPEWADGQAVSLQVALAEAERLDVDAIVVGLADQPGVTPEAWRRVAASRSPIAVATYDGVRGNPVRLHHSIWDLLASTGDEGARSLMRLRPELVEQVPCPGSAHDIDTREDLQLWQSRSSTSSP